MEEADRRGRGARLQGDRTLSAPVAEAGEWGCRPGWTRRGACELSEPRWDPATGTQLIEVSCRGRGVPEFRGGGGGGRCHAPLSSGGRSRDVQDPTCVRGCECGVERGPGPRTGSPSTRGLRERERQLAAPRPPPQAVTQRRTGLATWPDLWSRREGGLLAPPEALKADVGLCFASRFKDAPHGGRLCLRGAAG